MTAVPTMSVPAAVRRGLAPPAPRGLRPVRILLEALAVIALLCLNKAGTGGTVAFFLILCLLVLRSPEAAFRALVIGYLGLVANPAIVPKTALWTPARLLLPAACFVRFSLDLGTLRYTLLRDRYYVALVAFMVVAGVLSVITQYYVPVALLKLLNFAVVTTAIFSGVQVLRLRRSDMTAWFVTVITVTCLLGLASIRLGIGRNVLDPLGGTGPFNGPFYHSNCLGPMAAMMVVYLANLLLFGRYRAVWICPVLAACLVWFMYLTRSRTSFVAMLLGLGLTVGLTWVLVRRGRLRLRMNVSRPVLVATILGCGFLTVLADTLLGGTMSAAAVRFVNKGGEAETIDMGSVLASREGVIAQLWANFEESPLIGIGFEVAKSEQFRQKATLLTAPIEKGFFPLALLEETGVVGAAFFLAFLVSLLGFLATTANVPGIVMLLTFLAVNCGESMLFAVGGHGGFGWLLFAAGMLLGDFCIEARNPRPRPQVGG